jgi:UPF0042 nucleotide-binding protein
MSKREKPGPLEKPGQTVQPKLPEQQGPNLVIITGMAGAGKTQAMHTFEDIGYFCIDNLPPFLLLNLVSLSGLPSGSKRKLAVACDLRSQEFFSQLQDELARLQEINVPYVIIFLDATDDALLKRYKETRRRHPLCDDGMTLSDGIAEEREELSSIREVANYIIDTTDKDIRKLHKEIRSLFFGGAHPNDLRISVFSFGFKHSTPYDADIVIDVRFLPNPYYDPNLRRLTGLDAAVRDYVLESRQTQDFEKVWRDLLAVIMPGYVTEGKRYLSVGIGCTGGQHRSVVLAEETAGFLRKLGYQVSVTHRDLSLANTAPGAKGNNGSK